MENLPPEVLTEIFRCLRADELLYTGRLVCRKWNEICSSILLRRSLQSYPFKFQSESKFQRDRIKPLLSLSYEKWEKTIKVLSRHRRDKGTLVDLVQILQNSQNFPCGRWYFENADLVPLLSQKEMIQFLEYMGPRITALNLYIQLDKEGLEKFVELLTTWCPFLQELHLISRRGEKPAENCPDLSLPAGSLSTLKVFKVDLDYDEHRQVISEILKVAVNLKEIRGPWEGRYYFWDRLKTSDLNFWKSMGKLHLVTAPVICLRDTELFHFFKNNPDLLHRLQMTQLKVSTLGMFPRDLTPDNLESIWFCTHRMLPVFQDTLTDLEYTGLPTGLNWALFKNLRRLSIRIDYKGRKNEDFDPLSWVQQMRGWTKNVGDPSLPQLIDLRVEYRKVRGTRRPEKSVQPKMLVPFAPQLKFLHICFDGPILSSKTANIKFLGDLALLFPNISSLSLKGVECFQQMGPAIWRIMKDLTTLSLELPISDPDPEGQKSENGFPSLDSGFSGYSSETCFQIRDIIQQQENPAYLQESSPSLLIDEKFSCENASIFDMNRLEFLNIRLYIKGAHACDCTCAENNCPFNRKSKKEKVRIFNEALTDISKNIVFPKIPNLKVTIMSKFKDSKLF